MYEPIFQPIIKNKLLYSSDESFVCGVNKCNAVPAKNCDCGFYSLKDKRRLKKEYPGCFRSRADARRLKKEYPRIRFLSHESLVFLECEYYGQLIEGPKGMRAQHQRVMKVYIPKHCAHFRCLRRSTVMSAHRVFVHLTAKHGINTVVFKQTCGKHVGQQHVYDINMLRDSLGTEVEWI